MAQLVKTVSGLAIASVKTGNNLAIASIKTIQGVDNTSGGGNLASGEYTMTGNVTEGDWALQGGATLQACLGETASGDASYTDYVTIQDSNSTTAGVGTFTLPGTGNVVKIRVSFRAGCTGGANLDVEVSNDGSTWATLQTQAVSTDQVYTGLTFTVSYTNPTTIYVRFRNGGNTFNTIGMASLSIIVNEP